MLSLSAENRAAAAVEGGQEVEVDVDLDTEPRTVAVPPALAGALDAAPSAAQRSAGLSYSRQKAHVLAVEGARTDETRRRRIEEVLNELG